MLSGHLPGIEFFGCDFQGQQVPGAGPSHPDFAAPRLSPDQKDFLIPLQVVCPPFTAKQFREPSPGDLDKLESGIDLKRSAGRRLEAGPLLGCIKGTLQSGQIGDIIRDLVLMGKEPFRNGLMGDRFLEQCGSDLFRKPAPSLGEDVLQRRTLWLGHGKEPGRDHDPGLSSIMMSAAGTRLFSLSRLIRFAPANLLTLEANESDFHLILSIIDSPPAVKQRQ